MSTKLCDRCKRRIKAEALTCVCGWSAAAGISGRRQAECCIALCDAPALCRVWTTTGWANVCPGCYPKIERAPRRSESLTVQESREAYTRRRELLEQIRQPSREPGSDDEANPVNSLPLDALEVELGNRANP